MEEQEEKTVNRIILIGNGFDLAHGLKTRYVDFINKFWENQIIEANEFQNWKIETGHFVFENKFFGLKCKNYKKYTDISALKQDISYYRNSFLERIERTRIITNWVDLEELYYRELLNCLKIEKQNNDAFVVSPIKKLNEDFESVKLNFKLYLENHIVKEITNEKFISEIAQHIWKVKNNKTQLYDDFLGKVLFLNFNYTATEKLYTKKKGKNNEKNIHAEIDAINQVIHIHGVVKQAGIEDDDNPMIFGYGDELAVDFKDIENTNRNEFLENAKSIKYLETDNYDNLLRFLNENYEVFIFGHSCGLSDRTLLNTIFENEHCKKIRPFYHKESAEIDNFSEITRNISRNFTREANAKSDLRDKVEKKKLCSPLYYYEKMKVDLKEFLKEKFIEIDANPEQKINKFFIGKHQVTQAFYIQMMGCKNPSDFNGHNLPVERVSWYNCIEFCNNLSDKYQLNKYYNINGSDVTFNSDANGFRLPTEAEWEYAAIGGKASKNYKYSGSNKLDDVGWYSQNSGRETHKVRDKQPNELGIYDMSGNVWEWCEDKCDWKDGEIVTNPSGADRVLRGGSWNGNAECCAVSYRRCFTPGYRDYDVGFRLVLPP